VNIIFSLRSIEMSNTKALVDEIVPHARVLPEHCANALSAKQLKKIHFWIAEVCRIAVGVDTDDFQFPDDWLFKHRWVR
jgi:formamidopyrimidine-DNA glycosylase